MGREIDMKITLEIDNPFFMVGLLQGFAVKLREGSINGGLDRCAIKQLNSLSNQIESEALKQ